MTNSPCTEIVANYEFWANTGAVAARVLIVPDGPGILVTPVRIESDSDTPTHSPPCTTGETLHGRITTPFAYESGTVLFRKYSENAFKTANRSILSGHDPAGRAPGVVNTNDDRSSRARARAYFLFR